MILVVHLLTLFSLCQKQKLERGQENESWIISAEQQLKKNEEQQIHSEFTDDRKPLLEAGGVSHDSEPNWH